jgi:hypothetical protein
MDDRNPYAPSPASRDIVEQPSSAGTDIAAWRDGDVLITLVGAQLPQRCVKCNGPADHPTRTRKIYWHHPGVYMLVVINVVIYAIVAAIVRRRAFVRAGLCVEHKKRGRITLLLVWSGALGGIVLMVFGMASSWGIWGALPGLLLILGSIFAALLFARIVYAKKIDKSHVYLRGCGNAFLDSLPPFPGVGLT